MILNNTFCIDLAGGLLLLHFPNQFHDSFQLHGEQLQIDWYPLNLMLFCVLLHDAVGFVQFDLCTSFCRFYIIFDIPLLFCGRME